MELAKIRSLGDDELAHQEKTSAEQLFRLRFQVALGQNDGVKKLRQLRKEIAQIKTVARERELGIHSEAAEAKQAAPAEETVKADDAKTVKVEEAAPVAKAKAPKARKAAAAATAKTGKTKKAAPAAKKKTVKAKKGAGK